MSDFPSKAWFRAKRYGYGAGLPVTWQGWALFGAFVVALSFPPMMLPQFVLARSNAWVVVPALVVFDLIATLVFLLICRRKTEGGWRWRWGDQRP
ncbi:conserved hypothetical protein [Gluconacetobacter diazotrophicus PA1 5]|nr:conserved hypothetical protein [Gluconacetobacter diazotrophicus PA1 5]TWB08322.1 hypothetical protein FBZ86_10758 [Gluconacetobacter diazotrophicus]